MLCEGLVVSEPWNPSPRICGSQKHYLLVPEREGQRTPGTLERPSGPPDFQLLSHVLFLGLNSDTVLLCHSLSRKLGGVLLDLLPPSHR